MAEYQRARELGLFGPDARCPGDRDGPYAALAMVRDTDRGAVDRHRSRAMDQRGVQARVTYSIEPPAGRGNEISGFKAFLGSMPGLVTCLAAAAAGIYLFVFHLAH